MNGKRGLAAGLGPVNLDDSSSRITPYAQCVVECHGSARNDLHVPLGLVSELHYGSLAKILFNFVDGCLQRLELGCIDVVVESFYWFFSHNSLVLMIVLQVCSGALVGQRKYMDFFLNFAI